MSIVNSNRCFRVLTATGIATNRKYNLGVFNTFHTANDKFSIAICIKMLAGTELVETQAYRDCIDTLLAGKDAEFAGFRFTFEKVESFL